MTDTADTAVMRWGGEPRADLERRLMLAQVLAILERSGVELDRAAVDEIAGLHAIAPTGAIPDVVDGQIVESAWGNGLRDRSVTPFDTLAAATAAGGANGQLAVTVDTAVLYVRRAGAWSPISGADSAPAAAQMKVVYGNAVTAIAAGSAIAAATLPAAPYQRVIECYGHLRMDTETAAAGLMGVRLESGSTLVQSLAQYPATASYVIVFDLYHAMTIAAGAGVNVQMTAFRQSGTATGKTYADSTQNRLTLIGRPMLP